MATSLKSKNSVGLYGLLVANLAIFYTFVNSGALMTFDFSNLTSSLGDALPAGIGLLLTSILNAQLSADTKSRIVFMRWKHPLPGCRAFTRYAQLDSRVDLATLEQAYGPLPKEPREQNVLWYKIYKSVEAEPSVLQVHRNFLFARDYACLALMMVVVLGVAALLKVTSTGAKTTYVGILFFQFVFAGQAARNHGKRFVLTVLAVKSAKI